MVAPQEVVIGDRRWPPLFCGLERLERLAEGQWLNLCSFRAPLSADVFAVSGVTIDLQDRLACGVHRYPVRLAQRDVDERPMNLPPKDKGLSPGLGDPHREAIDFSIPVKALTRQPFDPVVSQRDLLGWGSFPRLFGECQQLAHVSLLRGQPMDSHFAVPRGSCLSQAVSIGDISTSCKDKRRIPIGKTYEIIIRRSPVQVWVPLPNLINDLSERMASPEAFFVSRHVAKQRRRISMSDTDCPQTAATLRNMNAT